MKLAVVIPAYKRTFFERALESLATQTDRDFRVYIGDDHSPQELQPIVDRYRDRLQLSYTRFDSNIGAKRLVEQWERCITLIRDEDWIWLFSDDDLASPNCVESFRRVQARTQRDVYRFNTRTIDEHDRELWPTVRGPDHESSAEMAVNLLHNRRGNSMPDHIFSREIYERTGRFVHTPFAQAADWATSIKFSHDKGMTMVQEGLVSWRLAGTSISSTAFKNKSETVRGHYFFINWLLRHFEYLKERPVAGVTYADMVFAANCNLKNIIVHHYKGLPPAMYFHHVRFMQENFGLSWGSAYRHLAGILKGRAKDRYRAHLKRAA
jgi:glycosyltransferase involved in cell wall biosynthesis